MNKVFANIVVVSSSCLIACSGSTVLGTRRMKKENVPPRGSP